MVKRFIRGIRLTLVTGGTPQEGVCAAEGADGQIAAPPQPAGKLAVIDGAQTERGLADPLGSAVALDFRYQRIASSLQMAGRIHSPSLWGNFPQGQLPCSFVMGWHLMAIRGINPIVVADEIRRRLRARGWTAKQLSLTAGLNESYVRDVLSRKSQRPRIAELLKIANALDCTVNDLISQEAVSDSRVRKLYLAAWRLSGLAEAELDELLRRLDETHKDNNGKAA